MKVQANILVASLVDEGDVDAREGEKAGEDEAEVGESTTEVQSSPKSTLEHLDTGEIQFHDADGKTRTIGTRAFKRYYRQKYSPEETRPSVLANSKEKLLLMYKQAGVDTSSELSMWRSKQKHTKEHKKMVQKQRRRQIYQAREKLREGLQVNLLIKNRVAKKNVGQGLGVHG